MSWVKKVILVGEATAGMRLQHDGTMPQTAPEIEDVWVKEDGIYLLLTSNDDYLPARNPNLDLYVWEYVESSTPKEDPFSVENAWS